MISRHIKAWSRKASKRSGKLISNDTGEEKIRGEIEIGLAEPGGHYVEFIAIETSTTHDHVSSWRLKIKRSHPRNSENPKKCSFI